MSQVHIPQISAHNVIAQGQGEIDRQEKDPDQAV